MRYRHTCSRQKLLEQSVHVSFSNQGCSNDQVVVELGGVGCAPANGGEQHAAGLQCEARTLHAKAR